MAEKKFWEIPELVKRLLPFLDVQSTLCLAQTHKLTKNILQGSHAWNKLIRRSCLCDATDPINRCDGLLKENRVVVKHLAAILKLMKDPKANMLDLLDTICKMCPPDVLSRFLGTVQIVSPTHPDSYEVFLSDFLLLEEVEGAFGTTEQTLGAISSLDQTLEEPSLSALSSRLSRQQQKLTSLAFHRVVLESQESAGAFKTLMQASQEITVRAGTINVAKQIGGEGWKMLAEGVRLQPDLLLDKFTLLKDDLDEAGNEDIRVIWDSLTLSGEVKVKLAPKHPSEKVKKTDGEVGWSRLVQRREMSKGEWATQFVQLRVVGVGQDLRKIRFCMKQTTNMKKVKNHYSEWVGVPMTSLVFLFDGCQINDDDTPKTLEMDEFDVIQVFRKKAGNQLA